MKHSVDVTSATKLTPMVHIPVLLDQTIDLLAPHSGGRYVDCTLGAGGHADAILGASAPDGTLLGLDADAEILPIAQDHLSRHGQRATLIHANFGELAEIAQAHGIASADGILFDLGVSSLQLDRPERGFSFQRDAPLDMRLDQSDGPTAADLIRDLSEAALADLFFQLGEERRGRQVARAIVSQRVRAPIETTAQLAALVCKIVPGGRIHPATRTFQALRIAVNDELEHLRSALRQAHALLHNGGRVAVISFHSLEDRIVKQYFATQANPCVCPPRLPLCTCGRQPALELVTRKAVVATAEQIAANPRSRSARLRVARRLRPAA